MCQLGVDRQAVAWLGYEHSTDGHMQAEGTRTESKLARRTCRRHAPANLRVPRRRPGHERRRVYADARRAAAGDTSEGAKAVGVTCMGRRPNPFSPLPTWAEFKARI